MTSSQPLVWKRSDNVPKILETPGLSCLAGKTYGTGRNHNHLMKTIMNLVNGNMDGNITLRPKSKPISGEAWFYHQCLPLLGVCFVPSLDVAVDATLLCLRLVLSLRIPMRSSELCSFAACVCHCKWRLRGATATLAALVLMPLGTTVLLAAWLAGWCSGQALWTACGQEFASKGGQSAD